MCKRSGILVALAVSFCLQACDSTPVRSRSAAGSATLEDVTARIDPARVTVAQIEWQVGTDPLTADERKTLSARLQQSLLDAVHRLPAVTTGRPATLRASIESVDTVSPSLNLLSAALLFLPLDGGGASVRVEAIDPATGEPLLSREYSYRAPMTAVRARFHRMAPANNAIDTAAGKFAAELRDAPVPALHEQDATQGAARTALAE